MADVVNFTTDSNTGERVREAVNTIPSPTINNATGASSSIQAPIANPEFKSKAQGQLASQADSWLTKQQQGGKFTPVEGGGTKQLAKDRIAAFEHELKDTQLLDRMEFVLQKEGGAKGALIFETACNRAMFGGATLKSTLFNPEYFFDRKKDPSANKTKPFGKFTTETIQKVIYGGANETNLATDQAYNDSKMYANHFIQAGVTGSWFDLVTGKQITDPGRITKLTTSVGSGMEEFIYRKDGHDKDGRSHAGFRARAYGIRYNIKPAQASTFNFGTPPPPDIAGAVKSDLTGQPGLAVPESSVPNTVMNVDPHGPTVVKNTNDCPKGMFTFPGVGAMVWVFFREGNPQFPVYFAASYSADEWGGAYGGNSLNPLGTNQGSTGKQTANSLRFNPNAGGGFEFTHVKDSSDPSGAADKAVAMMYGDDGSNMLFSKGYHQIYTRHDRRDQIDGHQYKIVNGASEEWIEHDHSVNVRGNVVIKIGKIDKEAMEAMKQLKDFSKQMNKMLLENPGNPS